MTACDERQALLNAIAECRTLDDARAWLTPGDVIVIVLGPVFERARQTFNMVGCVVATVYVDQCNRRLAVKGGPDG